MGDVSSHTLDKTTGWIFWDPAGGFSPYVSGSAVLTYRGEKYLMDVSGWDTGTSISLASYISYNGPPSELGSSLSLSYTQSLGVGFGFFYGVGSPRLGAVIEAGAVGFNISLTYATITKLNPSGLETFPILDNETNNPPNYYTYDPNADNPDPFWGDSVSADGGAFNPISLAGSLAGSSYEAFLGSSGADLSGAFGSGALDSVDWSTIPFDADFYTPSGVPGIGFSTMSYGLDNNYDGGYGNLSTFGTEYSDAWSSPLDFSNANSAIMGTGFDYTPSGVAGIGFSSGWEVGSGGYALDSTWSYTPYDTSNVVFGGGGSPDYYGEYGYNDYTGYSGSDLNFGDIDYNSGYYDGNYYDAGGYGDYGGYYGSYGDYGGYYGGYETSYSAMDSYYGGYDYTYSGGSDFGFGDIDYGSIAWPVVLDLDGDGIEITPLSSSNVFFDMAGDGRQHRTAWAGSGDGVLVFDADGDGLISERNEVVFTDWDPTAKDDMTALRNVFDTNDSGTLDSGDDQFASFKVLVTNADGTATLQTLAQAGIASIDLIPDAKKIVLPDGSTIDGETTFTRTDTTTGTAAAVTVAAEASGHILDRTVTVNGDGSTTIDSRALNADGSVAYEIEQHTTADGATRTLSFDNDGDGVTDKVQTIATVVNGDGSTTETLTNESGAGVLLDETVTDTSADGATIEIARDSDGDGIDDQTEVRTTTGTGATTLVLSDLNPNGSLRVKTTTTTSADGLTRTVASDIDGDGNADVTETDVTVINGDSTRTETVSQTNQNASLRQRTVTTISADGRTRSTLSDRNGDSVTDLILASSVMLLVDGSKKSTETTSGADSTLIDKTVTTVSDDGLSRTTEVDVTGDATFDQTTTDVTVVNGDGSRTQTVSVFNGNSSLREKTVTLKGADGHSRTVQADVTGDGNWDRIETISVDGLGATTDTLSQYNADGSLNSETETTTSADGLTVSTEVDLDGDGTVDRTTTSTTVHNGDGSSTVTEDYRSGNSTLLSQVETTTSADGLSITVESDTNGDGTFETTLTDVTVVNGDGSRVETATLEATSGALLSETVTTISADRKTTTSTADNNGDGHTDRQQTIVEQTNGTMVNTVSSFNPNGSLVEKMVTTTSDDGLVKTTQYDEDGDTTYDLTTTDATVLNADGSTTRTVSKENADTSLRSETVTTTSDDGFSTTVASDVDGSGSFDTTTIRSTVLNADGGQTTTLEIKNANGSLRSKTVTETSGTGLTTTTETDLDGNGTFDRTQTDTVTLAADGSQTETVTSRNADTSLRSETITTISADGRSVTVTRDTDGDGNLDETQSTVIAANGVVTDEVTRLNADASVRDRTVVTTSADGLTVTTAKDRDGDGTIDVSSTKARTLHADGSITDVQTSYAGTALIGSQTVVTSADGRSSTTTTDLDGDGVVDFTTTDTLVINANGSQVETVVNYHGDGTVRDSTETTTSADGRTITISADTLGDLDTETETLHKTIIIEADGDEVTTVTYPDTVYYDEEDIRIKSADGLSSSIEIDDPNAGFDWINVSSVTTLNSDGSRTEVFTNQDAWGYDVETTTSANGLSKSVEMNGWVNDYDPELTMDATDVTVLNADGSTTRTVTSAIDQDTTNSTGGTSVEVTTTSDDGLSTTVELDIDNDGHIDRSETTVIAVDGSVTETMTLRNYDTEALVQRDERTTSADGRSQSLDRDTDGDGVDDHFETTVTNSDGSVTGTIWRTDASSVLQERLVTTTSANGLEKSSTIDTDGDGAADFSQTVVTSLNADGSRRTVAKDYFGDSDELRSLSVTMTSANGLSKTTEFDLNGDGVIDETLSEVTTYYDDGWTERVTTETYADGSLKSETTKGNDKATYNSYEITEFDTDGDGVVDRDIEVWIDQDGFRIEYVTYYNPNGTQKAQVGTDNSPDGLSSYIYYGGSQQQGGPNESLYFMPGANESYLWNRFTATESQTSTHTIDLADVDHWTWANQSEADYWYNPEFHTTRIDLDTEKELIETARRIYDTALDRTMSQNEVQVLAGHISSGGVLDVTGLVNELLTSDEFDDKYGATLSDLQFVERVFQNALGRSASMDELAELVNQLDTSGLTRADIINRVSETLEHLAVGNVHAVTNNTQSGEAATLDHTTDMQVASNVVQLLFDAALDRAATTGELNSYADDILTGDKTQAEVAANILALPEFAATYGTLNNAAFVDQIFDNALGRAPTTSEASFWTAALGSGAVTRSDFLDGVAQSADHRAIIQPSLGGASDDIIYSRDGADTIDGGAGVDLIDFSLLATPGVSVNLATGIADQANGASDTLSNVENVRGTVAADVLIGDSNANQLTGGEGDDSLTGGGGADSFIFEANFGADTVEDFGVGGADVIQFDTSVFATYAAVQTAMSQSGGDVVITDAVGDTVTIKSKTIAQLTHDDFQFVA